jgi:hypothetical protein
VSGRARRVKVCSSPLADFRLDRQSDGVASFSTRAAWRPPPNSVVRKASRQALAMSTPMSLAPMAMQLASLCSRASAADSGSETSAQRNATRGVG